MVLSQYLESTYAMRLIANAPSHIGYLLKDRVSDVDTLLDAVDRVARGECVVDPAIVSGADLAFGEEADCGVRTPHPHSRRQPRERVRRCADVADDDPPHQRMQREERAKRSPSTLDVARDARPVRPLVLALATARGIS
jgi:hypothetical protein